MGGVKQRWLELESRNLSSIPDKNICIKHFEYKSINRFIKKNYQDGFCDYCGKELKVVPLEDLMEFIMDGISNFYEDAANFMSYNSREGGYLGEIYTPDELIQEHIELNAEPFEVIEDIVNSIEDIAWAQPDLYYDNIKDDLEFQWKYFKDIIKHKSRYLFSSGDSDQPKALHILQEVGKLISKLNIIREIPAGTKLYRCRQHDFKTHFTEFDEISAPPNKKAIYPNRFSPSGISMFYSAFDIDTAILETISRTDKYKKYVTIAEFETLENQIVVDFNKLPKIPSIFGIRDKKRYYLILFLYSFVRDITQQITKDGKEHTEYVPTQVVTEFLRYPFNKNRKNKISGIIYPSSQNRNQKSAVFFWDDELSKEKVKLNKLERRKII
ncbi:MULTISPECIES: HEPN-associated N-terminal domain-containing protein [unclassified Dysgonomonas]|jgi:hypothetical protein|uniref:HEPN-associated N-terminal domain-containing protein n=1 Tax=unclassified Dysgonomonas TaxID=2630389 RepID=UPI0025C47808|nr:MULTISPECIES: HEPN-associated N-terminal domain-containing protein [unclassified Dysgonomonas]HMM03586.1 HEPN-associated N-terminal domain-containing protein [Dysgonomonas sp.]